MEIKSSLLNDKDFALVKDSLIKASEKDGKEKFRVKLLEYINDISDNDDDEFFFDMIEFVRFLDPSDNATAYTTPEHLIFMNAPSGGDNPIGENFRKWDFTYDHECLHQLWDTFAVAEKLKKEGIKYDHYTLNVASDCVINDYLSFIRKKEMPDNLITPQYLKETYNVEYDRKHDTQYTLYLKLLEVAEQLKKDERCQQSNEGEGSGQQSGGGSSQQNSGQSQSGSGGSGSDNNSSNDNKTAEDAQKSADEAKKSAKEAQDAANKAKENGDKDADAKQKAADKAKEAAKEAQDAANKAKEAKDKGDKEGEEKAAKEAQDAANKAKQAANEATGKKDGEGQKGDSSNKNGEKGNDSSDSKESGDEKNPGGKGGGGNGSEGNQESDIDLKKLKERAEKLIEKYKNKISGDLGSFLKQCQSSAALKETGLTVQTQKGISLWNQQLNGYVKSYVKNKVFQKHREFKRTYQRVKRGTGFVEFGQPLQRGKKLKDDKLVISVAFYVDRSGSMTGTIDKVFDAAYIIAEGLKKQFAKEKVVGDIAFKMFTFDDSIEEIKWGRKVQARGGNLSMHQYLKKIEELTGDYMINIFITDGEFNVDAKDVTDLLKKLGGCMIYVTNTPSECSTVMKKISKSNEYATKLFYIDADKDFNIK